MSCGSGCSPRSTSCSSPGVHSNDEQTRILRAIPDRSTLSQEAQPDRRPRRAPARAADHRPGCTPRSPPRRRRSSRPRPTTSPRVARCSWSGCASCHGQNGEGIVTKRGTQYGPSLVGVGAAAVRLPGRHRPDAHGAARRSGTGARRPSTTRSRSASWPPSSPRLGAGPAIPTEEQYDPDSIPEDEREEAIVRGRRVLPHQLHRLPQLRRHRRRPARAASTPRPWSA